MTDVRIGASRSVMAVDKGQYLQKVIHSVKYFDVIALLSTQLLV
jgi:hypothetical protein